MLVDPDGHWVWLAVNAGFAAYDGYKAYKSGKGWKGVAIAVGAGLIGGGAYKGAKLAYRAYKTYKTKKYIGKATLYKNSTKNKSINNRDTDITRKQFGRNLKKSGYKRTKTKTRGVYNFNNGGNRYSTRKFSNSRGATAEFFPRGSKKAKVKIRFKK